MNNDRKQNILVKLSTVKTAKEDKPSWWSTNPISRAHTSPTFHAGMGAAAGGLIGAAPGKVMKGGKTVFKWKGGLKGALVGAGLVGATAAISPAIEKWLHSRGTAGRIRKAQRHDKPSTHYLTGSEKKILREIKNKR